MYAKPTAMTGMYSLTRSAAPCVSTGGDTGATTGIKPPRTIETIANPGSPSANRSKNFPVASHGPTAINGKEYHKTQQHTERSFLLFAIALERVALGKGTRSEITHQLATRVAHLIGANLEGRRDVARQMSRLYDRRSHIVHEGEIGVANDEMFLIYLYCMTTLHALVLSPAFSEMKANADLERWFIDRILEGPSHYDPEAAADHP